MTEQPDHAAVPLEVLEDDETVPPRPEEDVAEQARQDPGNSPAG